MKTLIVALTLFSTSVFADGYTIYPNQFGVPNRMGQSYTIEDSGNGRATVYENTFGIPNRMRPSLTIENNGNGGATIYENQFGVPNRMAPSYSIEPFE